MQTAQYPRRPRLERLRRDWPLIVMVLPLLTLLTVFVYVPLIGNVVAFQDYDPFFGVAQSAFVGLRNFSQMFGDSEFWHAVTNTLILTSVQLVLYFPVPIALALLLNSVIGQRVKRLMQAIVYLPHFLSWVVIVTLFQNMLGGAGLLNQQLRRHGTSTIDVLTSPGFFKFLVSFQLVWKEAGWDTVIFLAAIAAVNIDLYEAIAVDGGGRLRRLWHVTLPGIRPVIILLLILRLGDALSVGFEQMLLQRAAVGARAAEVLDTFVYFQGVIGGQWGYAAAAGIFKGAVGLVLLLIANKLAHAFGQEGLYRR
ncbi:putative aldouronate transport system permease protein [Kribbella aluminosa]|uniref:Aldouronate transport system permease protein n=1 Tax=Kribbella aluminosa TaxID=416017 RepID=A0ABS4UIW3_9ACTN|nr:ABC transporter permease subunit [Kribbella aluminosa]MBP2351606.1 putative aldouronate transport system permease protein [Kribbella aluminosa]